MNQTWPKKNKKKHTHKQNMLQVEHQSSIRLNLKAKKNNLNKTKLQKKSTIYILKYEGNCGEQTKTKKQSDLA